MLFSAAKPACKRQATVAERRASGQRSAVSGCCQTVFQHQSQDSSPLRRLQVLLSPFGVALGQVVLTVDVEERSTWGCRSVAALEMLIETVRLVR